LIVLTSEITTTFFFQHQKLTCNVTCLVLAATVHTTAAPTRTELITTYPCVTRQS